MALLEDILYTYMDRPFMVAEGFDDAVIGVEEKTMRLVYSMDKCIDILQRRMGYLYAIEVLNMEINGRYYMNDAPIFINDTF